VCISLCTTVIHNTAQNSSDNFPFYPPDNYHCLDDVYWREGGLTAADYWKHTTHKPKHAT